LFLDHIATLGRMPLIHRPAESVQNRFFLFQAEVGIRCRTVTGVQTCALPISSRARRARTPDSARAAPSRAPFARRRRWTRNGARDRKSVVQGKRVDVGATRFMI